MCGRKTPSMKGTGREYFIVGNLCFSTGDIPDTQNMHMKQYNSHGVQLLHELWCSVELSTLEEELVTAYQLTFI